MNLSESLKKLASGICPITGKEINSESIANKPESIRLLFALSDEVALLEAKEKKRKNTSKKKISNDKPANSHKPWSEEDKLGLKEDFNAGVSIEGMALEHDRSELAIAVQLKKLGLIDDDRVDKFFKAH